MVEGEKNIVISACPVNGRLPGQKVLGFSFNVQAGEGQFVCTDDYASSTQLEVLAKSFVDYMEENSGTYGVSWSESFPPELKNEFMRIVGEIRAQSETGIDYTNQLPHH